MSGALTKTEITTTIQKVCADMTASQLGWTFSLSLPPIVPGEVVTKTDEVENLYGVVARSCTSTDSSSPLPLYTTFFLAYSTWDGRVLFRDFSTQEELHDATNGPQNDTSITFTWYHLLAKVAVGLRCKRLVWAQYGQAPSFERVRLETLPSWLTLHWDLQEMRQFTRTTSIQVKNDNNTLRERFTSALLEQQQLTSASRFSLRLAAASDMDHITRLVRGLAEFEKELESLTVKPEEMALDGFDGDIPLFYCVLMDYAEDDLIHTCGMAFCYIGHRYETGRFLYLEDLFLEESYRGKGGGSLIMGALALAAQNLDCTKMVWQALDCK